ncbi:MAG: LysR family transcriptional regulator [Verrucomicrobiota bacterium]
MSKAHELIARRPFDLYQLHLFRLVAESGSFTRAAQITGLTQSAITRANPRHRTATWPHSAQSHHPARSR